MTINKPEKFENEIVDEINGILDIKMMPDGKMSYSTRLGLEHNVNEQYIGESTINEMSYLERCFLNGIIRQTKPKKILELGVSAGGSSAIILNAIKDFDKFGVTNGILFSCLKGKKLSFNEGLWNSFANIGAVILDENIKDNILDYLYLLTLPFEYLPTDNDILECQKLFSKNYEEEFVDTFMNIMLKNKQLFIEKNTISNDRLDDKVNKLIDTLAWWIPVRKWRDNFRNKFKI